MILIVVGIILWACVPFVSLYFFYTSYMYCKVVFIDTQDNEICEPIIITEKIIPTEIIKDTTDTTTIDEESLF